MQPVFFYFVLYQSGKIRDFFYQISKKQSENKSQTNPENRIDKRNAGKISKKNPTEKPMSQCSCDFLKKHDTER